MNSNIKPSDRFTLLTVIDPASLTAGTYTTGWVDMSDFENVLAVIAVGAMESSGTLDAKLEKATSGAGAGAADISGKAITQLTDAGTDDNKQVLINLRASELAHPTIAYTHARLSVTTATAASLGFAGIFGVDAKYGVASHAATVDQVVS